MYPWSACEHRPTSLRTVGLGRQLLSASLSAKIETLAGRGAVWLARLVWDQEVEGSNPFAPTRKVLEVPNTDRAVYVALAHINSIEALQTA